MAPAHADRRHRRRRRSPKSAANSLFGALAEAPAREPSRIAGSTEPEALRTPADRQWNRSPPAEADEHRDPDRAHLRRQPPRLRAVRPIRTEPRADRAPARRGRGPRAAISHARRLARRLRAGAPRARRPLRAAQARRRTGRTATSKARSAWRSRKARCSTSTRPPRAPSFEEINLRKRPVRARTAGAGRLYPRAQAPRARVRHRPRRHRQDLARGRPCGAIVRAQGGRPHHPVAAGGRGRRAARLPARRHAREGRSLSAADLRRALRPDGRAHRRARAADRRDRDRAARLHARPHAVERRRSSSTRRRTPPRCR